MSVSIHFTSYPLYSDFYSSSLLTKRGGVNFYRPGFPSTMIGFAQFGGEDRVDGGSFVFNLGDGTPLYARENAASEEAGGRLWLYLIHGPFSGGYANIIATSMQAGAATHQVTETWTGPYFIDVAVRPDYGDGYGYITAYGTGGVSDLLRWDRSLEVPSSSEMLPLTSIASTVTSQHEFAWVDIADDGEIWVGGMHYELGAAGFNQNVASIWRFDADGNELQRTSITSTLTGHPDFNDFNAAHAYVESIAAFGDLAVFQVTNEGFTDTEFYSDFWLWFTLNKTGALTDISSQVFVDDVAWPDYLAAGGDGGGYTQLQVVGDQILLGSVAGASAPTALLGTITNTGPRPYVVLGTHFMPRGG